MGECGKNAPAASADDMAFVVVAHDIGKYMRQDGAPQRRGIVMFENGVIMKKHGAQWIEATYRRVISGFWMAYTLTGRIRTDLGPKRRLDVTDLADIQVKYSDPLIEAKALHKDRIDAMIQRLYQPDGRVQPGWHVVPGGERLVFSDAMTILIAAGDISRAPLEERLTDKRIQNEVALILGAIGNEVTVSALIDVYPETDSSGGKAQTDAVRFNAICLTYALTYLTGQPIGRTRYGADLNAGNGKRWKDWWTKEKATYRVPRQKPNESWVPVYPVLSNEGAAACRNRFVAESD